MTRSGMRAAGTCAAVALLLVCGCGRRERPEATVAAASAAARPPARITVNFSPAVSFAPLVLARDEGYFAAEGLDVSLDAMEMNAAQLSLVTGKLDVFAGPLRPGLVNLIARGEDVAIVADKGYSAPGGCVPEAFVAPAEVAERIARSGTIRGERFATLRAGYSEFLLARLLERHKLTSSDIEHTFLPGGGNFLDPKKNSIVAVRYVSEPNLTNALASGMKIVASGEELAPGHQFAVLAFGKRLLRDEPELGQRFIRAYLRGVARYNEGKTDRNVRVVSRYTKLPPELVRQVCWQPVAADGHIRPDSVEEFFRWGRKLGYVEAEVPPGTWWDPRFVQAARRPGL